jgi:hypothetical protein
MEHNGKFLHTILDLSSSRNIIPKICVKLQLKPEWGNCTVNTLGNKQVRISRPFILEVRINAYKQEMDFVAADSDIPFCIFGMSFVDELMSINIKRKVLYKESMRFPFRSY